MALNVLRVILFVAMALGLVLTAGSCVPAMYGAGGHRNREMLSPQQRSHEVKKMGIGALMAIIGLGALALTAQRQSED